MCSTEEQVEDVASNRNGAKPGIYSRIRCHSGKQRLWRAHAMGNDDGVGRNTEADGIPGTGNKT